MKALLRRRQLPLLGLLIILASVAAWLSVWLRFQTLPQSAIHLLPDLPSPTSTDRILVFSPHPDDETLAVGGYIATAEQAGASVWVALATDGNKHGLRDRRYLEFQQSTGLLGVPANHLIYHGYADGTLQKQDQTVLQTAFNADVSSIHPTIIFAPLPEDRHPDHAVTGVIGTKVAQIAHVTVYQYLVHYPRFPEPAKYDPTLFILPPSRLISFDRQWQKFMLSSLIVSTKHQAVLKYQSQLKTPVLKTLMLSLIRANELFALPSPT